MDRQEGNGSEKQEQQGGTHRSDHVEDKEVNSLQWNWEAGGIFPRYVWNNQKIIDRDRAVETRCYLNNFKRYVRIIHPLKSMDNICLNFLGILFINMVDMCIVQCAVIHKKVTFSLLLSKILIQGFQVLDSLFYRSHQYLFNTCFIFKSCHVSVAEILRIIVF